MAEILEFQNYIESINKTKDIFNRLDVYFQEFIEKNEYIIDDKFIALYNNLNNGGYNHENL